MCIRDRLRTPLALIQAQIELFSVEHPNMSNDTAEFLSLIHIYDKLPKECRDYIEFAEEQIGVPIKIVSNGPSRDDIIYR